MNREIKREAEIYLMHTHHNEGRAIRDAFIAGATFAQSQSSEQLKALKKQVSELNSALATQRHNNNVLAKGLLPKEYVTNENRYKEALERIENLLFGEYTNLRDDISNIINEAFNPSK